MNPTSSPQMDNDVINLAKAIRQTESGGNFDAVGDNGTSHGAYQWQANTWKAHAKQALGDENAPMTPSNQNAVAYTVLKSWKDEGLNPAQAAARWNSGSDKGWENKVGDTVINGKTIHYDVPKYVKSVTDAYQLSKQGGEPQADPNNPSSVAYQQPEQKKPFNLGNAVGDFAKGLVSAPATMIARPLQAVAELAGVSDQAVNDFSKNQLGGLVAPTPQNYNDVKKDVGRGAQTVAFGLGPVAGGATFGAGSSLEQGNNLFSVPTAFETVLGAGGGKVLELVGKPLLDATGKAIGVITPEVLQQVASKGAKAVAEFAANKILPDALSKPINALVQTPEHVLETSYNKAKEKVARSYEDQMPFTPTQKIKEANTKAKTGDNIYTTYAEHGINVGSPEAHGQLSEVSDQFQRAIESAQANEHKFFNLDKLKSDVAKEIDSRIHSETARNSAKDKIQSEIEALLHSNPEAVQKVGNRTMVNSEIVERLRKTGNSWTPFNASDPEKVGQSTGYALANAVRDLVEKEGSFPAYREANREWGKVIHAQEMLTKIENSGKPYKTMGGLSGAIARRVLSGALGYHTAGIGGAVLTELGTEGLAKILSNPRLRTYFNRQIIKRFHGKTPTPKAIEDLAKEVQAYIKSQDKRLALPAPKAIQVGPVGSTRPQEPIKVVPAPKGVVGQTPKGKEGAGKFFATHSSATKQILDTLKDTRGSLSVGKPQMSKVKGLVESSKKYNTLSPDGLAVVKKYLSHVDGTHKLSGEELINAKADAQIIAEKAGLKNVTGSDKALANELADKYTKQIATPSLEQEAKKYKSAEEFVGKMKGSSTQYSEYAPHSREYLPDDFKNISELGIDPEKTVTIYRGIADNSVKGKNRRINDGDFVTTDYDSAHSYAGDNVVKMQVKAKHLYNDNSMDFKEDPFYLGSEYVYSTKKIKPLPSDKELTDIYNKAHKKPNTFRSD